MHLHDLLCTHNTLTLKRIVLFSTSASSPKKSRRVSHNQNREMIWMTQSKNGTVHMESCLKLFTWAPTLLVGQGGCKLNFQKGKQSWPQSTAPPSDYALNHLPKGIQMIHEHRTLKRFRDLNAFLLILQFKVRHLPQRSSVGDGNWSFNVWSIFKLVPPFSLGQIYVSLIPFL